MCIQTIKEYRLNFCASVNNSHLVYSFEKFLLIMQLDNRNEELWKEILLGFR